MLNGPSALQTNIVTKRCGHSINRILSLYIISLHQKMYIVEIMLTLSKMRLHGNSFATTGVKQLVIRSNFPLPLVFLYVHVVSSFTFDLCFT